MIRTSPRSPRAARAAELVTSLQGRLVRRLEAVGGSAFAPVEWLRDEGRHGGGVRYVATGAAFNRASVNVSVVHYDDLPDRKLASATALSSIVHPDNPHGPSIHLHVSHTELRGGEGYWRVMADLNPSIDREPARVRFEAALKGAAGELYEPARAQGDRYFYIPSLGRHRGVSHFYLEGHDSGDFEADLALARRVAEAAIDTYAGILAEGVAEDVSEADRARQLAYHTLYLFQVLTLDRGTTSGLLIHGDNDVGILGSLPARVDRDLLASWVPRTAAPQDALLRRIVDVLGSGCVDDAEKQALADVVRSHYRAHPEALALQASGDIVPPTVDNHR